MLYKYVYRIDVQLTKNSETPLKFSKEFYTNFAEMTPALPDIEKWMVEDYQEYILQGYNLTFQLTRKDLFPSLI